jgi:hypothetical protein
MKKIYLTLFMIAAALFIHAQTVVPGGIVHGTWTTSGSPFLIEGDINIPTQDSLIIEAGVTVNFQGSYSLDVQGKILALGSILTPILFTAADTVEGYKGVRLNVVSPINDSSIFEYCRFEHGYAYEEWPYNSGAGIFMIGTNKVRVENCTFYNNRGVFTGGVHRPGGGAIALWNSDPIIRGNHFYNNHCYYGGALICYQNCEALIENNLFENNHSPYQGGAVIFYTTDRSTFRNNVVINNTSEVYGGGICVRFYCETVISYNLVMNNTAEKGGGIDFSDTDDVVFHDNTIVENTASEWGGGINISATSPIIRNTIVWGNTVLDNGPGPQVNIQSSNCSPDILYCNVEGGKESIGGNEWMGEYRDNLDAYPMFNDPDSGDYGLLWGSPCINKGDTSSYYCDPDGTRCDIGAYYHHLFVGLGETVHTSQEPLKVYPSPAKDHLTIDPSGMQGEIIIQDILGQEVRVVSIKGERIIRIDVRGLNPGIYIATLNSGKTIKTAKFMVIR